MFGIIRSRPCEAVKVVVSAPAWSEPCTAPAAPPSACISWTTGTPPHRLVLPSADHSSASSAIGEEGVIGKIAQTSLMRNATCATAVLPSRVSMVVICLLASLRAQPETVRRERLSERAARRSSRRGFGLHFDGVAGAPRETDPATRAQIGFPAIAAAAAETGNRPFGAGREAIVAFEA